MLGGIGARRSARTAGDLAALDIDEKVAGLAVEDEVEGLEGKAAGGGRERVGGVGCGGRG